MQTATDLTAVVELQDKFYDLQADRFAGRPHPRGWDSQRYYAQVSVHLAEVAVRDQVAAGGRQPDRAHPHRILRFGQLAQRLFAGHGGDARGIRAVLIVLIPLIV
jgi:hypothetical protein